LAFGKYGEHDTLSVLKGIFTWNEEISLREVTSRAGMVKLNGKAISHEVMQMIRRFFAQDVAVIHPVIVS